MGVLFPRDSSNLEFPFRVIKAAFITSNVDVESVKEKVRGLEENYFELKLFARSPKGANSS